MYPTTPATVQTTTVPAYTLAEWPQTTAPNCHQGEQAGIDLFNDEEHGFTAIYVRYANGLRWPARTVRNASENAESILAAWTARGSVNDYRA